MKITYENSPDDIAAYGKLIYAKSPTVKQHRKKAYQYAVILIAIFGLALFILDSDQSTRYGWAVISVLWLIYIPFQHKRRYIKNMVTTYQDDTHKNLFGRHELTLENEGITDQIENGINKTGWDKNEHVEKIENYTFIFIDSALAYIIPENNVSEGSYRDVVNLLKEKTTDAS